MSKSVLVIDTPEQCCECVMGMHMCIGIASENYNPDIGALNEKCPLKHLPQKRNVENADTNYGEEPWFSDGWNACVDYLEGDGDETD